MPGLWIASAVMVLALGGQGQAQTPAAADSLSTAPSPDAAADSLSTALSPEMVGADTLGEVAEPALEDSLQLPEAADSLYESAAEAVSTPAPSILPPPAQPSPLPPPSYLPKQSRFAAQRRGYFTPRTLWAAGYLAGSLLLYNRGSDYRDKADDLYARYKRETNPTQIESFYQRTTTQDTKGQVCWVLSAALAVNGLRLLFTHETEVVSSQAYRPSLQMILAPQSLQLRVRKWL